MKNDYKLDNQQETTFIIVGSSETTCKTTFNFDFLLWFIGFLEGDCSFFLSNNCYFFVITQNELIVLYKIKHFIKLGRVQKHGNYFRFIIVIKKDFEFLLMLIIPHLYLYKTIVKIQNCLINFDYNLNQTFFLSSAWLSGFIDAEGCFYIRLVKRSNYKCGYQIRLLFFLDQELIGTDIDFFTRLCSEFTYGRIINRGNCNYRFIIDNYKDIELLFKYLRRYPLHSHKKSILFKHWSIVWRIKQKDEITKIDIEKIKKIKSWRYSPPKYESI